MMKKQKYILGLATIMTIFTGCATTVKPTYVSPVQYQNWGCSQLQSEYARLAQYIQNGVETQKRTGMGVGLGLGIGGHWGVYPTVSLNMGQSSNTKNSQKSLLMGQQDAIVQAANFKNCPIQKIQK